MCSYHRRLLYVVTFVPTGTTIKAHHLLPKIESSFRPIPLCSMTGGVTLILCPPFSIVGPEPPPGAAARILVFAPKLASTSCLSSCSASLLNRFKMSFILSLPTAFPSPPIAALARARFFSCNSRIRASTVLAIVSLYTVTSSV